MSSGPSFVQGATSSASSGINFPIAFPSNVTAGNLLIATCRFSPDPGVPTISDSASNRWFPIYVDGAVGVWYAIAFADGACTVTFTANSVYGAAQFEGTVSEDENADTESVQWFTVLGDNAEAQGSVLSVSYTQDLLGTGPWSLTFIIAQPVGPQGSAPGYVLAFLNASPGVGSGGAAPPIPSGWTSDFGGFYSIYSSYATIGVPGSALIDAVMDMCIRAGLDQDQIDTSLLIPANLQPSNVILGYAVTRPTPASEAIKVLMQAYFFDACESDGALRFIPRGLASKLTIPEASLGLVSDKGKLVETISQEQDLPQQFTVLYNDPAQDYEQGRQLKGRNTRIVRTKQQTVITFPMTMTADWARQVAEKALYLQWLERTAYQFNLAEAYFMLLDPTDVIEFVYEGLTFEIRVVENSLGQGFAVMISGVSENGKNYLSSASGGSPLGPPPGPTRSQIPTIIFIFDFPYLRDVDAVSGSSGFYWAATATLAGWPGASLLISPTDPPAESPPPQPAPVGTKYTTASAINFGFTNNALGAPGNSLWAWDDVNVLEIQMQLGALEGDTMLDVLNGANALIVGSEILQFTNAVENSPGVYTISGLNRGCRGTEWAIGTHATGELVVVPITGALAEPWALKNLNVPWYFFGQTLGAALTETPQDITIEGKDLYPYSPVHIAGSRDGSGSLTITWFRRTRIGGEDDWADGVTDVPLSEDSEEYNVNVMNGATVVRTINVTSETASYTAAEQTTDFGSAQASISLQIFQVSGEVGNGFAGIATV